MNKEHNPFNHIGYWDICSVCRRMVADAKIRYDDPILRFITEEHPKIVRKVRVDRALDHDT